MNILVTNDDGVSAPGLLALAQEMRALGDVTVLAPDRNWSASGHVKTMERPLRVRETRLADGSKAYTTDGAPSDCVALAVLGIFPQTFDLVASGINPNANVGHDVTYSGTVTAAMEAVIGGARGIAFSLNSPPDHGELDYGPAARIAARIARQSLELDLPEGTLLNVNIPCLPEAGIKGIQVTRQGLRVYRDALVRREDPRRRPYYWIGGDFPTGIAEEGTDFGAIAAGYVSVTPLQLDLTDRATLAALQKKEWK
jgi:5'-nucleotidase